MADFELRSRILFWRLRRSLRGPLGPAVVVPVLGLLLFVTGLAHGAVGRTAYTSGCMPYILRLPAAWQLQHVAAPNCGDPVYYDQFHLDVDGSQYALDVEAVSLTSDKMMGQVALPRFGDVYHSQSGQVYAMVEEATDRAVLVRAAFSRTGLSYMVTVNGTQRATAELILKRVMDGWFENPAFS